MIVKLLTERHLEFLSLKGGCTGSSESTLVIMSNCWKSRALAHYYFYKTIFPLNNDDFFPWKLWCSLALFSYKLLL